MHWVYKLSLRVFGGQKQYQVSLVYRVYMPIVFVWSL